MSPKIITILVVTLFLNFYFVKSNFHKTCNNISDCSKHQLCINGQCQCEPNSILWHGQRCLPRRWSIFKKLVKLKGMTFWNIFFEFWRFLIAEKLELINQKSPKFTEVFHKIKKKQDLTSFLKIPHLYQNSWWYMSWTNWMFKLWRSPFTMSEIKRRCRKFFNMFMFRKIQLW